MLRQGQSHAVFSITPKTAGGATISASLDGEVVEAQVMVTSPQTDVKLDLIIPPQTRTDRLLAAVYLVDAGGSAIVAGSDAEVNLSSLGGISVPDMVTIPNGTSGTTFTAQVRGSGSIAAAWGPLHDSEEVRQVSDGIEIKVGLSPTYIRKDSFSYYVVWFTRGGEPYIPPDPVTVTVHTSNEEISSLSDIRDAAGRYPVTDTFLVDDGVAYGRMYTHLTDNDVSRDMPVAEGTLTVTADGYGTDSVNFEVGEEVETSLVTRFTYSVDELKLDETQFTRASQCSITGTVPSPEPINRRIERDDVDREYFALRDACRGDCVIERDDFDAGQNAFVINQMRADIYPQRTHDEAYLIPSFYINDRLVMETHVTNSEPRSLYYVHNFVPNAFANHDINSCDQLPLCNTATPPPSPYIELTQANAGSINIPSGDLVLNNGTDGTKALVTDEGTIAGLGEQCDLTMINSLSYDLPVRTSFGTGRHCFCASELNDLQRVERTVHSTLASDFYIPAQVRPPDTGGSFGVDVYISSNGAEHPARWVVKPDGIATQAGLLPIGGPPKSYDVHVSKPGFVPDGDDNPSFEVVSGADSPDSVVVQPLPTIEGLVQDLAMIYITDSSGAVINPVKKYGTGAVINLLPTNVFLESDFMVLNGPVGLVRGTYAIDATPRVIAASSGILDGTSVDISQMIRAPEGTVSVSAPRMVRAGEAFPASAHLVIDGVAGLGITHLLQPSGGCRAVEAGLFMCLADGRVSIFEEFGSDGADISVFNSDLDVDITADFASPISVGGNYTIRVTTPAPDPGIIVESEIPTVTRGSEIYLYPDRVGEYRISVGVTAVGYTAQLEDFEVLVDNRVEVRVEAYDMDGGLIATDASLTGTVTSHSELTPFVHEFEQESVTVSFPRDVRYGGGGYEYAGSELVNGGVATPHTKPSVTFLPEGSAVITAKYGQVVVVEVVNGRGSGQFEVGDQVVIQAPERNVLAFLVREVLDRWTANVELPDPFSPRIVLVVDEDVRIEAVYRTDYTFLVVLVAGVAGLVVYMVFRSNNASVFRFGQLADHVGSLRSVLNFRSRKVVDIGTEARDG